MYVNLGLIGDPLGHTLSPMLHTYFLNMTGINGGYTCYEAKSAEELPSLIDLFHKYFFVGVNVTVPYKTEIMRYCDYVDSSAERIGAVNTLCFRNNKVFGYNTDVYGFERMLADAQISVKNKKVLILGAGGAARAVAEYMRNMCPAKTIIANRSEYRAKDLVSSIGIDAEIVALESVDKISCDIVINTTSVGLQGEPFPVYAYPLEAAIDIQYKSGYTPFLSLYEKSLIKKIDGFSMLVWQAQRAFNLWTGTKPIPNISKLANIAFGDK